MRCNVPRRDVCIYSHAKVESMILIAVDVSQREGIFLM